MKPFHRWKVALLAMATGACDVPDTRGCPLVSRNGADIYELEYELLIPADCPVPIGTAGERKRAGARIRDMGIRDFFQAEVSVWNSDGKGLAIDFDEFRSVSNGAVAEPATDYAAATGYSTDLDKAFDYGQFRALQADDDGPYGEVKITYSRSAMTNLIDGSTIPARKTTATWRAVANGGTPPYHYYWYRDGALVGTSEFYTGLTGMQSFGLRAAVVDQTMTERVAVMPVDVGGALVSITGPDIAYLDHDNPLNSRATWTASIQGGTAPFTYQWYRDAYPAGTAASHTEHIDERADFKLRLEIRDSTGKTAINEKYVRVAERSCTSSGCVTY